MQVYQINGDHANRFQVYDYPEWALSSGRPFITAISVSADGRRVAFGGTDNRCHIWDVVIGKRITTIRAHEDYVTCLSFSSDGRHLVTGAADRTVRLWDLDHLAQLYVLVGHQVPVSSMVLRDMWAVSWSVDGTKCCWDAGDGTCLTIDPRVGREAMDAQDADALIPFVVPTFMTRNPLGFSEVEVRSSDEGEWVGWFPGAVKLLQAHPNGRLWAGFLGDDVCLFALEGIE